MTGHPISTRTELNATLPVLCAALAALATRRRWAGERASEPDRAGKGPRNASTTRHQPAQENHHG